MASVTKMESGCWEFNKKALSDGYGRIKVDGRLILAHRASYAAFVGIIPDGMQVCHHCDNRLCCNPSHLFLGTNSDNQRDSVAKGRAHQPGLHGEDHPEAKLAEASVRAIRLALAMGESQSSIANRFNVSQSLISLINLRRKWSHVH